ncbi:Eisosome component PIL1-domain-containing protein [Lactarius akahatsu]|uniref:Eisosome component PIL1-domain-containing protein n=1 Tax=Lactarius akahatsu TaxID=416441 RepID=A0AAD4LQ27_9AGAM|nr:Eisosome component PIL1-domain-containing protein [Lactarius akahatsu]
MFKSAAAKLAHNSTIPALAGNKDLRPLQDLITTEKAIVTSLAKLSADFIRASEALRTWGLGEGDDLSDTLGGSTKILLEFSSSLTQFAAHEQVIREHMKTVRTQEEKLDGLKHRRKNVVSKADSAERKLSKLDSGHKNTPAQTELLMRLREEIRELDSEIMTEEAKLGDLKRTATREWMALKFGGLQECCRKGLIVAEKGKLIMTELPQLETEPGSTRPFYTGHPRTETYVADALRALGDVLLDTSIPSSRVKSPPTAIRQDSDSNFTPMASSDKLFGTIHSYDTSGTASLIERSSYGPTPTTFPADELGALPSRPDMHYSQTFSHSTHMPPSLPSGSLLSDAFPSSSQQTGSSAPSGGRFATFPVKGKRQGSFAPAIAGPQDSSQPTSSTFAEEVEQALLRDEPAPMYEATDGLHASPHAPPPGAAAPVAPRASLYGSPDSGAYDGLSSYVPPNAGEGEEDVQLPYMDPPQSEKRVRFGSRPIQMPRPWSHLERETVSVEKPSGSTPTSTEVGPFSDSAQTPSVLAQEGNESPVSPKAPVSQDDPIPTPPYSEVVPEDERALNAAAAREVSREMDALMYSPPIAPPRTASPEAVVPVPAVPVPAPLSIPPVVHAPPSPSNGSVIHPSSPFARTHDRSPVSPTASRHSAEPPSPTNVSPSPRVPSAPSSPTQQAYLPPPNISLPLSSSPTLSSPTSAPFRTPPELPANPSPNISQRTLPVPPGVSSPQAKTPPLRPPGGRTISAAAFRRPVPRVSSDILSGPPDVSPLSIKKRDLRGSPYSPQTGGLFGSTSSLPTVQAQAPVSVPPLPQQEQHQEDEFDYISAYYGSEGDDLGGPPGMNETRARSGSLR